MKPAPFRYVAPREMDEALALLGSYGGEAKLLAGGQSLVPLMNLRLARPAVVIDINRIAGLDRWARNGSVEIGALVRQRLLETGKEFAGCAPLLAEAVRHVGHPATRSRGTIVGSLCHADPAAELPVCALALGAELMARSAKGVRAIPAGAFFRGAMTTALSEDEMVERLRMPLVRPRSGFACEEVARRHGDFALVVVACVLELDGQGAMTKVSLALGGVAPRPMMAPLDSALLGQRPGRQLFREVAQRTADGLETWSDLHATAKYRKWASRALIERALMRAAERAGDVGAR
jgi:carbon-monoxide dehydrogenase medium subunit